MKEKRKTKRLIPTKAEAQKWANALRSGKFKQTHGTLQDENGYCCLGVACEIFIPKNKKERELGGYLVGTMPRDQEASPEWLKCVNGDLRRRSFLSAEEDVSFTKLNDRLNYTFDMIADIIELVYVHKALG